jgi:tight adherence protein C
VAGLEQQIRTLLAAGPVGRRLVESRLRADLQLLGLDETAYTARKVLTATATLAVGPVLLAALTAVAGLPWLLGAWVALLAAAAVFVAPDQRVKRAAATRRRDFQATLTAYLDLVAMRAASGSGVAEALRDAAAIGSGYGWRRLRAALEDARLDGRSPATGLATLGAEIQVAELTELAAQLSLVDATGAQAEATLRAKAEALREQQLTDLHGNANARSQTMLIGQVGLGLGFLILIGYPALAAVLAM